MTSRLALGAAALLVACGVAITTGDTADAAQRRARGSATAPRQVSWIVGSWIERRSPCGGYRADGTYSTDIQEGRWRLSGNTLIETALSDEEQGGDLASPQTSRSQILSIAANRNAFSVRYPDGRVWHMKRCRWTRDSPRVSAGRRNAGGCPPAAAGSGP